MRYGIFSDVHSNLEALEAVVNAYKRESIDNYLCVGDIVGYGANPEECIKKVKGLAMVTVASNHDWASVGLLSVEYFNPDAKAAVVWTKERLCEKSKYFLSSLKLIYQNKDLTLAHGTLDTPENFDYMQDSYTAQKTFELMETGVCFVGHSHRVEVFIRDPGGRIEYSDAKNIRIAAQNKYIVNVGSVGQPRDGNPRAAYCIYDTREREVQLKRVDYDARITREKIIACGLPQFLGDRLLVGR